ncbi:MAG: hypothetical protein HFE77_02880 [Clostridiales bacterium]|nr:hypothetical protein [Clostridiales bacterium]
MASETVLKIKEAEEKALLMKSQTAEKIKAATQAAKAEGEKLMAEASEKASELRISALRQAEEQAVGLTDQKRSGARVESEVLMKEANAHMDQAIDIIVEGVKSLWQ